MARGRKPDPAAIQALKGNPRKGKRRVDPAPLPLGGLVTAVDPPAFLGVEGRAEWSRIVGQVTKLGLLRDVDIGAFVARNAAFELMVKAYTLAKAEGLFYVTDGVKRAHPGVKVALQAMAALAAFNQRFGLDPESRAKVTHVTGEGAQPAIPGLDKLPAQTDPSKALPGPAAEQAFTWNGLPH